jgi:hypothetical protein
MDVELHIFACSIHNIMGWNTHIKGIIFQVIKINPIIPSKQNTTLQHAKARNQALIYFGSQVSISLNIYENCYIWRHTRATGILPEPHRQEIFWEILMEFCMTLTTLAWTRNQLVLGRPSSVTECRTTMKSVRRCCRFLICDWPWLRYLGREIDCCSVDHSWSLIVQARTRTGYAIVWAPSVCTVTCLRIPPIVSFGVTVFTYCMYVCIRGGP